jgi:hypothetical protein
MSRFRQQERYKKKYGAPLAVKAAAAAHIGQKRRLVFSNGFVRGDEWRRL